MTEQPNTVDTNDRDAKLRQSYSLAQQALREAHVEEFNRLRGEFATKLGVEWSPRPTKEEKAQTELERLLSEHPNLIDSLAERLAEKTDD